MENCTGTAERKSICSEAGAKPGLLNLCPIDSKWQSLRYQRSRFVGNEGLSEIFGLAHQHNGCLDSHSTRVSYLQTKLPAVALGRGQNRHDHERECEISQQSHTSYQRESRLASLFALPQTLTFYIVMTNFPCRWGTLFSRFPERFLGVVSGTRDLQAFRHRGGFGEKLALVPQGVRAPFCFQHWPEACPMSLCGHFCHPHQLLQFLIPTRRAGSWREISSQPGSWSQLFVGRQRHEMPFLWIC